MTTYPINFTYSHRDGAQDDGFAKTAEWALASIRSRLAAGGAEQDDLPNDVRLTTTEAGSTQKRREDVERDWAGEIAAGWARPIRVQAGWKIEVETWEAA